MAKEYNFFTLTCILSKKHALDVLLLISSKKKTIESMSFALNKPPSRLKDVIKHLLYYEIITIDTSETFTAYKIHPSYSRTVDVLSILHRDIVYHKERRPIRINTIENMDKEHHFFSRFKENTIDTTPKT